MRASKSPTKRVCMACPAWSGRTLMYTYRWSASSHTASVSLGRNDGAAPVVQKTTPTAISRWACPQPFGRADPAGQRPAPCRLDGDVVSSLVKCYAEFGTRSERTASIRLGQVVAGNGAFGDHEPRSRLALL